MMMNKALMGVLSLAFVPGIVLIIAAAVSTVRNYGLAFLGCRFQPVREKLRSILREMHPEAPGVTEAECSGQQDFGTAVPVVATRDRSHSASPLHRCSY
jgi:hypothetical protein